VKRPSLAILMLTVGLVNPIVAQNPRLDELANLPFREDYPTTETAQRLTDELLFERAVQSYVWGPGSDVEPRSIAPGASHLLPFRQRGSPSRRVAR
jgi:hypothetical protein